MRIYGCKKSPNAKTNAVPRTQQTASCSNGCRSGHPSPVRHSRPINGMLPYTPARPHITHANSPQSRYLHARHPFSRTPLARTRPALVHICTYAYMCAMCTLTLRRSRHHTGGDRQNRIACALACVLHTLTRLCECVGRAYCASRRFYE